MAKEFVYRTFRAYEHSHEIRLATMGFVYIKGNWRTIFKKPKIDTVEVILTRGT